MANEKRLIYLEDAIEKIVNFPSKVAHDAFYGRKQFTPMQMLTVVADRQHEIIDLLKNVKEVDAVEVVRCRDCKHYDNTEGIQWCHLNSKFARWGMDWHSFPEGGFCSYGERKMNDEEG